MFDAAHADPTPGPPPDSGLAAERRGARHARRRSRSRAPACDRIQEGTGFVVGPDLVVTNAHVVAGERRTEVQRATAIASTPTSSRSTPTATSRVLRVPGLATAARCRSGDGDVDDRGAVFGHPGGGPLRAAPARIAEQIAAAGTDIYRTGPTERDVFVLAAVTAPGRLRRRRSSTPTGTSSASPSPSTPAAGTAYALTRPSSTPCSRPARSACPRPTPAPASRLTPPTATHREPRSGPGTRVVRWNGLRSVRSEDAVSRPR